VRPEPKAKVTAEKENVDIRLYRVIYQAIEDINAARVGMLAPEFHEEDTARVEVRELFRVPKIGVIAGSYVQEGEIHRDDKVRIVRDGAVVFEGKVASLRRFKDDVKSVKSGYECGVSLDGFQDLKEGDIIEAYKIIEVARES
jgi:translation initiation factor IF-2